VKSKEVEDLILGLQQHGMTLTYWFDSVNADFDNILAG
jgi:hypothetical protein